MSPEHDGSLYAVALLKLKAPTVRRVPFYLFFQLLGFKAILTHFAQAPPPEQFLVLVVKHSLGAGVLVEHEQHLLFDDLCQNPLSGELGKDVGSFDQLVRQLYFKEHRMAFVNPIYKCKSHSRPLRNSSYLRLSFEQFIPQLAKHLNSTQSSFKRKKQTVLPLFLREQKVSMQALCQIIRIQNRNDMLKRRLTPKKLLTYSDLRFFSAEKSQQQPQEYIRCMVKRCLRPRRPFPTFNQLLKLSLAKREDHDQFIYLRELKASVQIFEYNSEALNNRLVVALEGSCDELFRVEEQFFEKFKKIVCRHFNPQGCSKFITKFFNLSSLSFKEFKILLKMLTNKVDHLLAAQGFPTLHGLLLQRLQHSSSPVSDRKLVSEGEFRLVVGEKGLIRWQDLLTLIVQKFE